MVGAMVGLLGSIPERTSAWPFCDRPAVFYSAYSTKMPLLLMGLMPTNCARQVLSRTDALIGKPVPVALFVLILMTTASTILGIAARAPTGLGKAGEPRACANPLAVTAHYWRAGLLQTRCSRPTLVGPGSYYLLWTRWDGCALKGSREVGMVGGVGGWKSWGGWGEWEGLGGYSRSVRNLVELGIPCLSHA